MISPRGHVVVWSGGGLPRKPTYTVDLSSKWYGLVLVRPSGKVEEVAFPDTVRLANGDCNYVDHAPNPRAVVAEADALGFDIDPLGLELMIGRWWSEGFEVKEDFDGTAETTPYEFEREGG